MTRLRSVFLAAVLLSATACNRTNKTEQLAALDSAYQSGLLTKDEYDAKRRALTAAAPTPVAAQAPAPLLNPTPAAAPPPAPPQAPRDSSPPAASPITPSSQPITPSVPRSGAVAHEPEPAPLAGCEEVEYKPGGQKGAEERFFAAPPEAVRRAAVSALDGLDFNIHKTSKNVIEASKKRHIGVIVGAGGERVILTFQKTERGGQSGTRVIGETKKSFVGHMAQRTWTDAVLAEIGCKLRSSR
jgi:hypothetical protein